MERLRCDVLVAGGGPAGFACALAAARNGARVILCHDRPVLGGNASSEVRMHIVGADGVLASRSAELSVEAREGGIIEEIRLDSCVGNPQRSPSVFDLLLYDKCRREPNLELLLNTAVTGVEKRGKAIAAVFADRLSTEDRLKIDAEIFVDCTGDGRLGIEAGAAFRMGREAASEFGEGLAPAEADAKTLGSTLLLMAKKHPHPMPFTPPPWARRFDEYDLRLRPHARPGFDAGLEYGFWWIEWGGCRDTIKENEPIRDELLAVVLGVWDHLKNGGSHGAECWALDWIGFVPGKRESRRFTGQFTLSESDILQSTVFSDAIAFGGWPIDTHPPGGIDAVDEPPCTQTEVPHLYDIPLRACVARDIPNLMFAGRNISATHIAFASTRVMATCAAIGQGVGTSAALCLRENVPPAGIAAHSQLMNAIQQKLLRDDAFLIGVQNDDPADLARRAEVSASSAQPAGPPDQALSGFTRCVHGPGGAAAGRSAGGSHRWMSAATLPAWIELQWGDEVSIGTVILVFDTGMHRLLTFSLADGVTDRMLWGRPQPETVRAYQIQAFQDRSWWTCAAVGENHQRRREHAWEAPVTTRRLRILVTETNGIDHARICEIRVYEQSAPSV